MSHPRISARGAAARTRPLPACLALLERVPFVMKHGAVVRDARAP